MANARALKNQTIPMKKPLLKRSSIREKMTATGIMKDIKPFEI